MKMNKNVYGALGIVAKNSNWNAEWDGFPKQDGNGNIKASPYALQYCIKRLWDSKGQIVLGLKTSTLEGVCYKLSDKYESLFAHVDTKAKKDKKDSKKDKADTNFSTVLYNLLNCKDVINFGVAYTGESNMSLRGVVQFSDAIQKYDGCNIVTETILSPYANSSKEEVSMATNGTRITTDEAHYLYDFTVFPKEYDKYVSDNFKGYQDEDYQDFKENSLLAVSLYNSKAKAGCKNEFGLFVTIKEEYGYLLDLSNLESYIKIYKEDGKIVYDLTSVYDLLKQVENKIDNIEMFYNPRIITIKGWNNDINNTKVFDLISRKEM